MAEQQWRIVGEMIQAPEIGFEQALMDRLSTAVHELTVSASVLGHMQQATTAAVRRAFQYGTTRVVCVTISTPVTYRADGWMPRSWGFFLVDRGSGDGGEHHIELFVYPDGS